MSDERLYMELEELCNYDYDEMQRTLGTLQDMLNQSREFEEEENEDEYQIIGFDKEKQDYINEWSTKERK